MENHFSDVAVSAMYEQEGETARGYVIYFTTYILMLGIARKLYLQVRIAQCGSHTCSFLKTLDLDAAG